jgi:hypothetical protein
LLPVEHDGAPPIPPSALENAPLANRPPPLRKRASRALSSLVAFCVGVAVTLAWWSYGDATGQMSANSYAQLGWLAPRRALIEQEAPNRIAASAVPYSDQLDAILRDLHAMRQSLDRIVAGQELITQSIDEIATSIAARQQPIARSTDGPPQSRSGSRGRSYSRHGRSNRLGSLAACGARGRKGKWGGAATDIVGKRQAVVCDER